MHWWHFVMGAYFVMSLATLVVYAWDKRAARLDHRRVPERTLHLMELLGGWPGGLIGIRMLRHKSSKGRYLLVFWVIVALHMFGWGWWAVQGKPQ